jgi:hypothetical protein
MSQTAQFDYTVKRNVAHSDDIIFEAVDLTDADLFMQVRAYKGAPGDAMLTLENSTAPAQGLSVSVTTTEGIPESTVFIRIDKTTIQGMLPFTVTDGRPNRNIGTDVTLYYDLLITPDDGAEDRRIEGKFIILEGVSDND